MSSDLFQELGHLMPELNFNITMIGSEVSPRVNGKVAERSGVKVTLCRCLYHKYTGPRPDIVIGRVSSAYSQVQNFSNLLPFKTAPFNNSLHFKAKPSMTSFLYFQYENPSFLRPPSI